jgi:DNA polymerase-1
VACCFDSATNHRKAFTEDWEHRYKDRPEKDPELKHQLGLVRDLLSGHGFACVGVDGMEADDVMASYAKQFDGKVTLLTQDKDARQCLSEKCNMLLDVEWTQDEHTGEMRAVDKWLTAKQHTESTGVTPEQWICRQTLSGDTVDNIKGASNIGEKGATELVKRFGSASAAIEAAKRGDESLLSMARGKAMAKSLIEFEPQFETTVKLVTLRTDLEIPSTTRVIS